MNPPCCRDNRIKDRNGFRQKQANAIDRLKEIVPIWKKEYAVDGASWVEPHA